MGMVSSISLGVLLGVAVSQNAISAADDEPPAPTPDDGLDRPNPTAGKSSAVEYCFEWNVATLAGDYEKVGRRNPSWDKKVLETLSLFAQSRSRKGDAQQLSAGFEKAVKEAIAAGCDDPLINYLHARFAAGVAARASKEGAQVHVHAAEGLERSKYAEVRKFYGCLRAAEALRSASKSQTNTPPEVHQFRRSALNHLVAVLNDKRTPIEEVHDACRELMGEVERNKKQLEEFYFAIEKPLFANWPQEALALLIKGNFYIKHAWKARGKDYADKVTEEGWKLFFERLTEAEKALEKAWSLDPTIEQIALSMMTVELGQGKGRERMEMWFDRAMRLNSNSFSACSHKLYYLEPKWHGSPEAMLKFGRECVNSAEWGGRVPMILAEAHYSLASYLPAKERKEKEYWKRPGVWKDVKASFDKFFEKYPDALGYRHNYARYAYWCEQWDDLNKQLGLMGPVNYDYFGGKMEFEKMVKLAKERSGGSPK